VEAAGIVMEVCDRFRESAVIGVRWLGRQLRCSWRSASEYLRALRQYGLVRVVAEYDRLAGLAREYALDMGAIGRLMLEAGVSLVAPRRPSLKDFLSALFRRGWPACRQRNSKVLMVAISMVNQAERPGSGGRAGREEPFPPAPAWSGRAPPGPCEPRTTSRSMSAPSLHGGERVPLSLIG
jgi:hypothetical protein